MELINERNNAEFFSLNNLLQLFLGNAGPLSETVLNALPAVDTFFFLSGTLVAYLSFIQLEKRNFNLVMFYVHRYIRFGISLAKTS